MLFSPSALGLAVIELFFFFVATCIVLCFGSVTKTVVITY